MKKLIAIALCFVFTATVFSGCRGSVRDPGMTTPATEPTTAMTVPSMPSEPSVPSEPTTGTTEPSVSPTEPTTESGAANSDGMDAATPRRRG